MGEYMSVITGVFLAFLQIMIVRKIHCPNNIFQYVVVPFLQEYIHDFPNDHDLKKS